MSQVSGLYAGWSSVSVTFYGNGGTPLQQTKTFTYGNTYGTFPTVTRTGYSFDGWYTSSSGGINITTSTKVTLTSDHTLYAQWEANGYIITLDPNGGEANETEINVTYDDAYGDLP